MAPFDSGAGTHVSRWTGRSLTPTSVMRHFRNLLPAFRLQFAVAANRTAGPRPRPCEEENFENQILFAGALSAIMSLTVMTELPTCRRFHFGRCSANR